MVGEGRALMGDFQLEVQRQSLGMPPLAVAAATGTLVCTP